MVNFGKKEEFIEFTNPERIALHYTLNRQQQLRVHTHQPDANASRLADMAGNRFERACQLDVHSNWEPFVPPIG